MGVFWREAGGKVGDATADVQEGNAGDLGRCAERTFGTIAEECAATKGPRRIDSAAPVVGEQRARAQVGQRKAARPRVPEGDPARRMVNFLELDGGRVRLAADDREVAARGLLGHLRAVLRAGTCPALHPRVRLGVEREEFRAFGRTVPLRTRGVHGTLALERASKARAGR